MSGYRPPGAWIDEIHAPSVHETPAPKFPRFTDQPQEGSLVIDALADVMDALRKGIDEATEKMVVAYLQAHGYVVIEPSRNLWDEKATLRREVVLLQAKLMAAEDIVASLKRGGSVAP